MEQLPDELMYCSCSENAIYDDKKCSVNLMSFLHQNLVNRIRLSEHRGASSHGIYRNIPFKQL